MLLGTYQFKYGRNIYFFFLGEEETDQRRITTTTSPRNTDMFVEPKPHVDSNILIAVAIVISVV